MARLAFNLPAVQAAADAAVKTDAAKSEAKKALVNWVISGGAEDTIVGANGALIPNISKMKAVANDFIAILLTAAGEVPASVATHLQSTTITGPSIEGDKFVFGVEINGNLHRVSLYPAAYGGVDNIVALFDQGYTARNYVYGNYSSGGSSGDTGVGAGGRRIRSRISRDPMGFMSSAEAEFNAKYSGAYNVVAHMAW